MKRPAHYPAAHSFAIEQILISDGELEMLSLLNRARLMANGLGHPHDSGQISGSYGSVEGAFKIALRNSITKNQVCFYKDADIAVTQIIDLILDSGESVAYCIDYFNNNGPLGGWED